MLRDLEEDRKAAFDMFLMSFTGKYEGALMKKLRETGEWVTDQTETKFQASGNQFSRNLIVFLSNEHSTPSRI